MVGFGGGAVIATIALIFLYLLWVVVPIAKAPAIVELESRQVFSSASGTHDLCALGAHDRLDSIYALRCGNSVVFVHPFERDGVETRTFGGAPVQTARRVFGAEHTYAVLDAEGELRFIRLGASAGDGNGEASVRPTVKRLFSHNPWPFGDVRDFDASWQGPHLRIARLGRDGTIELIEYEVSDEALTPEEVGRESFNPDSPIEWLRIGPRGALIYALGEAGRLHLFQVRRRTGISHLGSWPLVSETAALSVLWSLFVAHRRQSRPPHAMDARSRARQCAHACHPRLSIASASDASGDGGPPQGGLGPRC